MQENLDHIIESLLFVSEEPLTVEKLKKVLETVETKEIRSALQTLAEEYESRGGGFKIVEVAGGWQLRSRPEYNQWIKRMLQPPPQRLSKAALETLAIVAYNQPIIRADIEHIRGVDCGGVLRQLLERKLIRVLGRKEIPGRPLIYATTKLFLELFELKDLKDLPSPKEIEEMSAVLDETAIDPTMLNEDNAPFDITTANEDATGQNLPKMRFTMPVDSSDSDRTDREPVKVSGPISHPKVPRQSNTLPGIASRPAKIPAGRSRIGWTIPRMPEGNATGLPGSDK